MLPVIVATNFKIPLPIFSPTFSFPLLATFWRTILALAMPREEHISAT
jgi:hypothetical protein